MVFYLNTANMEINGVDDYLFQIMVMMVYIMVVFLMVKIKVGKKLYGEGQQN